MASRRLPGPGHQLQACSGGTLRGAGLASAVAGAGVGRADDGCRLRPGRGGQGVWAGRAFTEVIEMQIVLLVTLLILGHAHIHYFALIFPLYFIALRGATSGEARNETTWLFVFSLFLLGFLVPLRLLDPAVHKFIPG